MSKNLTFTVTISLDYPLVDDGDILQVAKNIAEAIKKGVNDDEGITPMDIYPTNISVKPQFIDESISIKLS